MSDREWREAPDLKPATLLLVTAVAVGFGLRLWNIGAGVPYAVGIDEPAIMSTVLRILKTGDYNPHFFEYPTGVVYFHLGVAVLRFLTGAMKHAWYAVEQVGMGDFYLWSRVATATLGSATVVLLHQVGMRWGARHAVFAAGLFAVMPLAVREAHFALTDTPLVFAVTLTLLLSLRATEKPGLTRFILAGAAAGLCAGLKYNGLYAVVMPIIAALMAPSTDRSTRVRDLVSVVLACVLMFFVTTPFAIVDLVGFLNGFGTQTRAFVPVQPGGKSTALVYVEHFIANFGWPAFILGVVGLGMTIVRMFRGPGHARFVLLFVFPALFFNLITGWSFLFARYALPVVPFVCVWAAIATISGVSFLRRFDIPRIARRILITALTVAALLPPTWRTVRWDMAFGRTTTQTQAYDWITHNIWFQSKVISEAKGLDLPMERYKYAWVRSVGTQDPAKLVADGVEWVILSSDTWATPIEAERGVRPTTPPESYAALLAASREVKVFTPETGAADPIIVIRTLTK